jgi:tRNA A-37 threonylcarbamoyl transferase component Bud32
MTRSMTPERRCQVRELFLRALEQPKAHREVFVRESCAHDPELESEVRSLLLNNPPSGGPLDGPWWEVAPDLMEPFEHLPPDSRIGKYRVLRKLPSSGMGLVYVASNDELGKAVVLKALPRDCATDETRRKRLTDEAAIGAQFSHRAIAMVFDLVEADGQIYMVSEFVPGATLREELVNGPLAPSHLISTLIEIASALAAIHARNIIHRDLKPENIVRRDDGQIKVVDFGLARLLRSMGSKTATRQTDGRMIAGTPGYMAPEVVSGSPADARSDVFALGVLGWELATGRTPGRQQQLKAPHPVPGLEAILSRCVHEVPDRRYPSGAEVLTALRNLKVQGRRGPAVDPTWWRIHQATIAVLDAAMVVLAWRARDALGRPEGSWAFLTVLGLAVLAVTLRLNLLFVSTVYAEMLVTRRARVFPWIAFLEVTMIVVLLTSGLAIGSQHEILAALVIVAVLISFAALVIIEPTTTRGAGLAGKRVKRSTPSSPHRRK